MKSLTIPSRILTRIDKFIKKRYQVSKVWYVNVGLSTKLINLMWYVASALFTALMVFIAIHSKYAYFRYFAIIVLTHHYGVKIVKFMTSQTKSVISHGQRRV